MKPQIRGRAGRIECECGACPPQFIYEIVIVDTESNQCVAGPLHYGPYDSMEEAHVEGKKLMDNAKITRMDTGESVKIMPSVDVKPHENSAHLH